MILIPTLSDPCCPMEALRAKATPVAGCVRRHIDGRAADRKRTLVTYCGSMRNGIQ
jgi:hypothetical protein